MGINNAIRRLAASIACFAMLFAALVPSISHAVSAARGEVWTEICSATGSKFVKFNLDQNDLADPGTEATASAAHCPFCATHGGSPALLPSAVASIALATSANSHPRLFFQSPRPLAIWTKAQPRAPPVLVS